MISSFIQPNLSSESSTVVSVGSFCPAHALVKAYKKPVYTNTESRVLWRNLPGEIRFFQSATLIMVWLIAENQQHISEAGISISLFSNI